MAGEDKPVGTHDSVFEDGLLDDVFAMISTPETTDIVESETEEIQEVDEVIEVDETEADVEEVEEETEETDETNSLEDADDEQENNDSSSLTPYAKYLVDEGVLSNLDIDTFDGTPEALLGAMRGQIDGGIEQYKSELPEDVKTLIERYEEGVPFNQILDIQSDKIKYESIKDSELEGNEELQKNLLRDLYSKKTSFSADKINKLIQRSEDLSELEEEAKGAKLELIDLQEELSKEAGRQATLNAQAEQDRQIASRQLLDTTLSDLNEIIPNVKVTQILKDKIKANLTTPVGKDANGNILNKIGKFRAEDPIGFELKLNYIFEVTNQFTDWSIFGKTGKKSVLTELENASRALGDRRKGSGGKGTRRSSAEGLMSAIEAVNGKF